MVICVFGASSEAVDKVYKDACYELGKELAKRGHNMIFGAGGEGLMGASAKGFYDGGATVKGVIPQFFIDNGYEGVFKNCESVVYTETMAERKKLMEDGCDAFIIVPGGIGTFEEFFEILTLKQLGRHKKAIAIYNINGFYDGLEKMFDGVIATNFVNKECKGLYKVFTKKEDIINYLENYSPKTIEWDKLKSKAKK